jgi:4-aminobutyrate aminotransferase-like enzyme
MSRAHSSKRVLELLRKFESRNIISIDPDGTWPIVWSRAKGVNVWDADGKKYLDLTAAFGVAAAGHANPAVVKAGQKQMGQLLHAMGDVHPHPCKAELTRELSRVTFERWNAGTGKTIFCNSGFESVEAAMKTAMLATGKRGIITFEGAYHGLGYGALNATHRQYFRSPFRDQLKEFAHFVPFPVTPSSALRAPSPHGMGGRLESQIRRLFHQHPIGAILVEPVQGRAGNRIPPPDFLPILREICNEYRALLIADEVFTGFGRTGRWFACEHTNTIPDLICLGKALSGGFPISACVGKAAIMDAAWPESPGEAIHTSTFLGHPVGCAMALAQVAELEKRHLIEASAARGRELLTALTALQSKSMKINARGLGLMAALELSLPNGQPASVETFAIIKKMLQRGYILLPEGEHGNVISFTPPLTIKKSQLLQTVAVLAKVLDEAPGGGTRPTDSKGFHETL